MILALAFVLLGATAWTAAAVTLSSRFISEDFPPNKQVAGWNHRVVRFRWDDIPKSGLIFGAAPNVGASDLGYGEYTVVKKLPTDPPAMPDERPEWTVHSGYAVFRGWFPIIRTRIVRAVSPSTTLAIEISADGTQRIYVIQGTTATVEILKGKDAGKTYTLNAGQFLKVQGSGSELGQVREQDLDSYGRPKPIWNDLHAQNFFERVTSQEQYKALELEFD